MNIKELKQSVENKTTPSFMIWKLTDSSSDIIAEQYYRKIAADNNLIVQVVNDLSEVDTISLFDDILYIYRVPELKYISGEYTNLIVITEKTSLDAVEIPALTDWQLLDYLKLIVPGVKEDDIKYLISQYTHNYGELICALEGLKCFREEDQQGVINEMLDNKMFQHSSATVFDFADAMMARNVNAVRHVLEVRDWIDFEPALYVQSCLLKKFKQLVEVQTNDDATVESSGCTSDRQLWYIKNHMCYHYSNDELYNIYGFLTGLEYKFKFEGLSLSDMTDYMIVNILGGIV